MADLMLPPGVGDTVDTSNSIPIPPGVGPTQREQEKARPGLGERAWAHAQEGFENTILGASGASADLTGAKEATEIKALQNQIKVYEARPGFLGGPDKERIATLQKRINELTGQQQKSIAAAQVARSARKQAYEEMPPAEGILENTAAVAGHVAGALASPETFLGGLGQLGKAKTVMQSTAPVAEKALAVGKEALTGGRNMAAATGGTNVAVQTAQITSGEKEKYNAEEFATQFGAGFIGGTVFAGVLGQFAKPIVEKTLLPADEAVKAARAERVAAFKAAEAGDESVGFLTKMGQEINQGLFNWYAPVIRIQKEAGMGKTVLEKSVKELQDAAVKLYPADEAQLLRGTASQVSQALNDGTFMLNEAGNEFVKTSDTNLIGILKDLGPDANSFLEYVAHLRAAILEEQGIKTGFNQNRIREIISGFGPKGEAAIRRELATNNMNPLSGEELELAVAASIAQREKMNAALAPYKEWTDWILDYKKQSGIYDLGEVYAMKDKNPVFIPFYRFNPETGEAKMLSSTGKDKRIQGSELTTNDLAENLVTYLSRSLEAANKNRFRQSLYDMIDTMDGGAKYATRNTDTWAATKDDIINQLMRDTSVSAETKAALPSMTMEDLRSVYFKKRLGPDQDVVYRNGTAHVYTIHDKALMTTLKQLTPRQLYVTQATLKNIHRALPDMGLSELKGMFTNIVTHNPAFAAYTNLMRDTQAAFIFGKTTNIPVYSQMQAMWKIAANNPEVADFYRNGGGYSSLASIERNTNINKMYARAGIDFKRDVLNDPGKIKQAKDFFLRLMEQPEYASRISEFTNLTEKGVPQRVAALAGREVTVDFGGYGAWQVAQEALAIMPFLGASLNATRRIGRRLDKVNAPQTIGLGMTVAAAAVSAHIYNQKHWAKEYEAQPQWLKDTNILIGYPKYDKELGWKFGGFFAFPKEQGIGFMFGTIPTAIMDSVARDGQDETQRIRALQNQIDVYKNKPSVFGDKDKERIINLQNQIDALTVQREKIIASSTEKGDYNILAKGLRSFVATTFNVFELPPITDVTQAVAGAAGLTDEAGIKKFTGAPVVPKDQQNKERMTQFDPQTSSFLVELGEKYNVSPKLIDNAGQALLLYLWSESLTAAEHFTDKRDRMGRGSLPKPNFQDMPFIGRAVKDAPPKYGPADEEFYRLSRLVSKESETMGLQNKRMDFTRTYEALKAINPKYGQMGELNPTITEVQKQIAEIDNSIALTWGIKNMDPRVKREELNKLGWQRTFLMSSAIEQLVKIPEVRTKLRPQGVIPFAKTLWSGSPQGYAEGGLVERESWDGSEEEPMTVNPDFKLPDQFLGQEVRSAPEETVGGEMTNAMNAGLTGRSYPDVGPRSFLLPFQYNEFTGQYEFAMPGIMDAFPIGGGPVPAGGATSNALIGISRMPPNLWHGSKAADAVMDSMGFRKGKSAERNKPGTSTSVDPHVSTLTFADSPEGLLHVRVPKGNNEGVNPRTQVRNIDPFTYAIAAEAEEIPGVLVESKPAWPYKEFELFFKGKKQKYKHPLDSNESVHEPSVTEQPLSGQERLYPERNEQTRQVALAARKRAVQLDDLNGEIYKGFKNGDERHALESIQKAWKLAKGYPRLEMRVLDEGLQYLDTIARDIEGVPYAHKELINLSENLDSYKMHRKAYDEFIERVIRPNKVQLKKAVDENKWNIASKEDIQILQMKKISEYEPNKSFSQWAEDTSKPRLSVRQIANETNDRYRAMMRAKDRLTQAMEKADPSKIKRITRNPDPKNYTKIKGADFYESNKTQAEGFEHPPYGEFDEYNPATGKWEQVLGPEDIKEAKQTQKPKDKSNNLYKKFKDLW